MIQNERQMQEHNSPIKSVSDEKKKKWKMKKSTDHEFMDMFL